MSEPSGCHNLIQDLSSPEMVVHQRARATLVSLGAFDDLREAFREAKSPNARQLALRALVELDAPDLESLYVEALEDPAREVRSLSEFSGVSPRRLDSPDRDLRMSAVRALAWCERPSEEAKLLAALRDEWDHIGATALHGLAKIWEPLSLSEKLSKFSLIVPLFHDSSRNIRCAVCRLAGRLHTGVVQLLLCLEDPDDLVCKDAALALGEIGDPVALEPLIQQLSQGSWPPARALANFRNSVAVSALIDALKIPTVAGIAAESLGLVGDPRAIPPLKDFITSNPRDPSLRPGDGPSPKDLALQALERLKP